MSISLDLICDFRVLFENVFQKKLFGKCKTFHSFFTLENKLTPEVVDNVMIADNEHLDKLSDSFEIMSSLSARAKEISNRDDTLKTEVHFWYFIFFIVNYFVIFLVLRIKFSWQETI